MNQSFLVIILYYDLLLRFRIHYVDIKTFYIQGVNNMITRYSEDIRICCKLKSGKYKFHVPEMHLF